MGKWLIALYVAATMFLSGFARADQIGLEAKLDDVTFEKATLDFLVTGRSADACKTHVMVVNQTGANGEVIELRVLEAVSLAEMCIQKITPFSKRIPTKELVYLSSIQIDPDQVYTLRVANTDVAVQVLGSELLN